MDCPPSFWLNRIIDWLQEKAAYMSEKKTRIVTEESRYAVIEFRRNEIFPERFVIAYRDQESLRPQRPRQHPRHRVELTETRRITCAILQNAVVAGALLFYSRSALGAVIRAFVGAS